MQPESNFSLNASNETEQCDDSLHHTLTAFFTSNACLICAGSFAVLSYIFKASRQQNPQENLQNVLNRNPLHSRCDLMTHTDSSLQSLGCF